MAPHLTFEQSFRRYPFAELVSLGVTFARATGRLRRQSPSARGLGHVKIPQAAH